MIQVVKLLMEWYTQVMANGDPRLADWPLMKGPLPVITICFSYVYFVKYLGPQLMKDRSPFDIRRLMIAYNFFMVIISALLVYVFAVKAWFNGYSLTCQPVDYSPTGDAYVIAVASYSYFIVKFLEFFDTIFFVLRKKFSHVSTLHVIHHGIMPFSVWWGLKFVPGGHATFFGFINSFVHVIMYTYYGLAAVGPQMNKYLWWKRYLTVLQMVQFILIFIHSFQLLFRDCSFPRAFGLWISAHGVLFWFLFSHFYRHTYLRAKSAAAVNGVSNARQRPRRGFFETVCSPNATLIQHLNHSESKKQNGTSNNKYSENNNLFGKQTNGCIDRSKKAN
ncbi:Elongation of very long chain fatty acids protein-like protein [Leptotrombidium deliense]|uniref:Elongation of very long chain fatty acids protein n=1 Tax=Leptotrombidium deliense TaxID=299467 RepID=A0A443SPE2_9ACAR|nr:Elongation of very long chain fatty acids protein-like protein [Leptotrombidium deliense]